MADVTMSVQLMVQCQEQTTLPAVGAANQTTTTTREEEHGS